jgi:hypothetical protein
MQPWITSPAFIVEPLSPVLASPWATGAASAKEEAPAYQSDENLKKQYGIELAKAQNPFEAGCKIFGEETSKALWVSFNWINDPIVVASRDIYLKTVELSQPLLDREQLAAKVLVLAEGEKILINGKLIATVEPKDRLAAYKLYSDIAGYTGKVEIDNSVKNITNNELTIKLVKAEDKKPVVIDNNAPNSKSEMTNEEDQQSPIKLKLVAAG